MILNFENSQFLTALTQKVLQGIKNSFEYAHWDKRTGTWDFFVMPLKALEPPL